MSKTSSSLILSQQDLQELTGRKQAAAQAMALAKMRIPHMPRPDGRLVVLVDDVRKTVSGAPPADEGCRPVLPT